MKTPTLLLTAALFALPSPALAQSWMTPATSTVQTAQAPSAQVAGPTGQSATVTRPDGTSYVMPISLDLLPYGTVELSANTYMISNYENTGVTIMIYAPKPLRVATYAEMMNFQAQYAQLVRGVTQAPTTVQASSAQPVSAPFSPAPQAQPVTQPQFTSPAPQPQYVPPSTPALPTAPQYAAAPSGGPIFTTATATQMPAQPVSQMQAPATQAQAAQVPVPAPVVSAAPQPRDAAAPTALPDFLRGSFTGKVLKNGAFQISYSVVNRSRTITAKLAPQDLRVNQGGAYLAARLDARDSSGEPTMIPPQSGQIGTVTFSNQNGAPVTLEWLVQDLTNHLTYPVRYTWQPSAAATLGSAVR